MQGQHPRRSPAHATLTAARLHARLVHQAALRGDDRGVLTRPIGLEASSLDRSAYRRCKAVTD